MRTEARAQSEGTGVREIAITREKCPSVRLLVAAEGERKHWSLVDALPGRLWRQWRTSPAEV